MSPRRGELNCCNAFTTIMLLSLFVYAVYVLLYAMLLLVNATNDSCNSG